MLSTQSPCPLWVALLGATLLIQCKPADEPPRDPRRADGPAYALATSSTNGTQGTIRLVAPERAKGSAPEAAAAADGELGEPGDQPPAEAPASSDTAINTEALDRAKALGVTEPMLAALSSAPSSQARQQATEANRIGLKRHRNLDLGAAVQAYEAGLDAWPAHLFSRYNLACAQALSGAPKAAMLHLAVLSVSQTPGAADRLRAARVDPDFESLRSDESFRKLTGYASVEVSWSPSVADAQTAVALVDLLRRESIPAHEGREWRKDLDVTTLYVAVDHAIAQGVADEIVTSKTTPARRVDSRFLNDGRPIVLVIGAGEASTAAQPALATSLPAMIGQPVTASHDGIEEDFLLKPTGFFVWSVRAADGTRIEKTGRYNLKGEALHLDFRMTTTRPGDPPTVTVEQGRRENHVLSLDNGALMIGATRFTR